jgi:cell surface protein SprA
MCLTHQTIPFYLPRSIEYKKGRDLRSRFGQICCHRKGGRCGHQRASVFDLRGVSEIYRKARKRAEYFKSRSNAIQLIEQKGIIPSFDMKNKILDRIFGGSKVEIIPQGNLQVALGGSSQKVDNPNIPLRARRNGGLDFDLNMNLNVIGKIGDKLQLGIKYNTQTGFDFDNQVKLGWTGDEDDIVKEIELGNVSLPLPTRLINGSQTLFGFKTKLQFGRLFWTSIISQQKSKRETLSSRKWSAEAKF